MLKRVILVIAVIAAIALAVGLSFWFKPKPDYANQNVDVSITADSLFNAFSKNEKAADSLYLGTPPKVIVVKGVIKEIIENQNKGKVVVLQTPDPSCGISCTIYETKDHTDKFKTGNAVKIKGTCSGYNGMEGLNGAVARAVCSTGLTHCNFLK